jgi:YVTN family beta-propeller protein
MSTEKIVARLTVLALCLSAPSASRIGGLPRLAARSLPPHSLSSTSNPKRASSAIAVTADGDTLLVVNPDSNSLTLVDTAGESVIAELPVGVDPRTVAVDERFCAVGDEVV